MTMDDEERKEERSLQRGVTDVLTTSAYLVGVGGIWKDEIKAGVSAAKDKLADKPSQILGPDGKPRD
jgi:hypothetical protein